MFETRLNKYMNFLEDLTFASHNEFQKAFKSLLPYNISLNKEKGTVKFTMSVAGYGVSDLDVTYTEGVLVIKNKANNKEDDDDKSEYIHKGLAMRLFEIAVPINPRYEIQEATLKNGLLNITFQKTENKLPNKVEIKTS
jgi:molecular chaperone IbpA